MVSFQRASSPGIETSWPCTTSAYNGLHEQHEIHVHKSGQVSLSKPYQVHIITAITDLAESNLPLSG